MTDSQMDEIRKLLERIIALQQEQANSLIRLVELEEERRKGR